MDFTTITSTFAGFVAGLTLLTELANKSFGIKTGWLKQAMSWILAIIIGVICLVTQGGMFVEFGDVTMWQAWVKTIVVSVGGALVANGVYDIEFVKNFIRTIFKTKPEMILE